MVGGGRAQYGLGDERRPHAVCEGRESVDLVDGAGFDGAIAVGHECVEAVLVALRVTGWNLRIGSGRRIQVGRIPWHELRGSSSPHPEGLWLLLVEGHGRLGAGDLEEQPVLAPGGDLADDDGSRHSGDRSEHDDGDVLRRDRAERSAAPDAGAEGVDVATAGAAFRERRHELRAHGGEPVTGHELDQIAPVRADVGEGTGWPSEGRVDTPIVILLRRQPVLQIGAVDEPQRAETRC